jgi:hypothetical protein
VNVACASGREYTLTAESARYRQSVGLEADAILIAAGDLHIVDTADVLEHAERNMGKPIPVAAHRTGEWCTALFLIKQTDGYWRDEVVPVRDGEVTGYGGGTGGILRRSEVALGAPHLDGEGRTGIDGSVELVQVAGVSADESVRMVYGNEVVARTPVAAHGYFLLTAVLPIDAQVTVQPG